MQISEGQRLFKGRYKQRFNHIHQRVGHLYQGRYKAIIVQRETYLLELSRYIVLNPVRARMVYNASEWKWSSYRSCAGIEEVTKRYYWLLSFFHSDLEEVCTNYRHFVDQGLNQPSPFEQLKNQVYLGDDNFVEQMQGRT